MDRKQETASRTPKKPARKLRPMEAPRDAQGGITIPEGPGADALRKRLTERSPPPDAHGRTRSPGTVEK